jgi:hypothetical protein
MSGFARLLIQFLKVRQTYATNIELTQGCLADGETRDSQSVHPIPAAIQEARSLKIREETVDGAHGQPRPAGDLLGGEALRRLTEKLEQSQPTLQGCNVVASLLRGCHSRQENLVTK